MCLHPKSRYYLLIRQELRFGSGPFFYEVRPPVFGAGRWSSRWRRWTATVGDVCPMVAFGQAVWLAIPRKWDWGSGETCGCRSNLVVTNAFRKGTDRRRRETGSLVIATEV